MSSFPSASADLRHSFSTQQTHALLPLREETLDAIRATNKINVPNYPLSERKAGIVHFGPGGFASGHFGVYVHELLKWLHERDLPLDCAIMAVSARLGNNSAKTLARRDQLAKQDFLYTVLESAPGHMHAEVIGSLMGIMIGPDDPKAVYELLASEDTKLVTGTVTNIGNRVSNSKREEQFADYILKGLRLRYERGMEPFAVMSCDNVPGNSEELRRTVITYASLDYKGDENEDFRSWIREKVRFHTTMVDRIVPEPSKTRGHEMVKDHFGIIDDSFIFTEPYRELVIGYSDDGSAPPFAFDKVGAILTQDIGIHETAKREVVNGGHAHTALLGRIQGIETIEEFMADSDNFSLTETFMQQAQATQQVTNERNNDQYRQSTLSRFQNPEPPDYLVRLVRNATKEKIEGRLIKPLNRAYQANQPRSEIVNALAHWIVYLARANPNPNVEQDGPDGLFINDPGAYEPIDNNDDITYVNVAKSCNGSVEPVFSLPLFAAVARESWGNQFRKELQQAYTAIIHPSNDNLNPDISGDKKGPTSIHSGPN